MKSASGVCSTGLWVVLVLSSLELCTHTFSSTTTIPAEAPGAKNCVLISEGTLLA